MSSLGPKIKIAQVITRMDWGGSPDIVRILSNRLDTLKFDVWLIYGATEHPSLKTKQFLKFFEDRAVFIPHLVRNLSIISDILAFIELYNLFRKEKFDIVHTHTAKAGTLARLAASLAGVKVIVHTPHGHNFYGYFSRLASICVVLIEKFLAIFTDKIVALTQLEYQDYLKFKLAGPSKISLIYQGLELDEYRVADSVAQKTREELKIRHEEQVVGIVCRLEPIKGAGYFIEAAREVLKSFDNLKLVIVGEGSLRKDLENMVKQWGLSDRFIFTGWREDVASVMSIFEILVLPSLNEAVGMVLIEAQSLGIPVIASRVGGIPEVVKDKETGLLVPSADYRSLAAAIKQLLADKGRLLRLGKQAKVWVNGRFRAEDMVETISQLYQKLLADKKCL
jgi:glycosyltransferase involved in cell wall biosynthesis